MLLLGVALGTYTCDCVNARKKEHIGLGQTDGRTDRHQTNVLRFPLSAYIVNKFVISVCL